MGHKRKLVEEQIDIFFEIQAAGFNIVTCGNCGTVLLHRMKTEDEGIQCFGCMEEMDYSDCPDLWYEGATVPEEEKPFTEWCKSVTINNEKL
jgi:predicted nucleic-acid-binding Zn-ribbon protein